MPIQLEHDKFWNIRIKRVCVKEIALYNVKSCFYNLLMNTFFAPLPLLYEVKQVGNLT